MNTDMGGKKEDAGREVRRFADVSSLQASAAAEIVEAAGSAVRERGICRLALSGGSTPRALYRSLATPPLVSSIDWERLELFWSDERDVPPDDPRSNYRMAHEAIVSKVPVPVAHVHRVETESESPVEAAARYEAAIRRAFGGGTGIPRFDVIMLGMGADGHTASLFPGTPALMEHDRLVVANRVASMGATRITMTFPLINAARLVMILVTGKDKAPALRRVLEPEPGDALPAAAVRPVNGRLLWLVDGDAASLLDGAV